MSWQGGVAASILGSFTGTLGTQLRISSLAQEEATRKALVLQVFGWTFWLTGQGLGQVAILLAPASLTASVNFSGSLLSNALLAPLVLNESLTRLHALSIVLLVVGSGMVTSSSSHADQEFSYLQLRELAVRPAFVLCAAVSATLTTLLLARAFKRRALGLLSFAYIFALVGAIDLLVAKFTLQLARLEFVDTGVAPAKKTVFAWAAVTIILHICVFMCQVVAAYYRKALTSLPLFLGSGAFMQVLVCGTFFNEFSGFGYAQQLSFSGGLVLVMMGMICTSMATASFRDKVAASEPATPAAEDVEKVNGKENGDAMPGSIYAEPTTCLGSGETSPKAAAVITSGLLERSSSSMSSADLLLLGDIQKSALCFGGRYAIGRASTSKVAVHRRFASDNFLLMPLDPGQVIEGRLGRAASAPPGSEARPLGAAMRRETSAPPADGMVV